jgi:hypothetical protein
MTYAPQHCILKRLLSVQSSLGLVYQVSHQYKTVSTIFNSGGYFATKYVDTKNAYCFEMQDLHFGNSRSPPAFFWTAMWVTQWTRLTLSVTSPGSVERYLTTKLNFFTFEYIQILFESAGLEYVSGKQGISYRQICPLEYG